MSLEGIAVGEAAKSTRFNSVGLGTLARREIKRTIKIINQVVWPPAISTLLYFFIFVVGLGRSINTMEGLTYVAFLVPGLVFMNVVEASFGEGAASLFIMRFTNSLQELLVAPLSYGEMVLGMIAGSVMRAFMIGTLVLLVGLPFGGPWPVHPWWALFLLLLVSVMFSALGLLMGIFAESFDQMSIPTTFFITPLVFLGGVFTSVHQLPPGLRQIAVWNPMVYLIDGFRTAITGRPSDWWTLDVTISSGGAILAFWGAMMVFKSGYKLRP